MECIVSEFWHLCKEISIYSGGFSFIFALCFSLAVSNILCLFCTLTGLTMIFCGVFICWPCLLGRCCLGVSFLSLGKFTSRSCRRSGLCPWDSPPSSMTIILKSYVFMVSHISCVFLFCVLFLFFMFLVISSRSTTLSSLLFYLRLH